ncbi:hypothetical protein RHGRI_013629 [Rhododendron griersonianum]|uniref:F-box associated domain-containing protein n=1 Tax=Rhododendron griersonianum TaxID=479676 RepID=A0AAV6K6K4_9ERIC|nr:hypothetical protein RHGRI_013629 [Rhododendron griersonianum]
MMTYMAVVSFDMGVEVFRLTPLPKMFNLFPLTDDQIKECSLALLKDSLAVICSFSDYVSTTFALWVMKENYKVDDDVESCWFLVSTWGPHPGLCTSLGFGKNNELLIRTGCGLEFGGSPFLYDVVTKKVRELKLSGEPNFIYKQSLVSVTGGN